MLGVFTPTSSPISFRMTKPKGTSSQKNLAYKFKVTFSPVLSTGIIGKGTLLYPILVLKTLFKLEVSETWPSYIEMIRSFMGITCSRSRSGYLARSAFLIV
jgi:hypothetical protein